MPDKAIDLLDLVLVRAKMNQKDCIDCQDIDEMVEELMNMKPQHQRLSYLKQQLLEHIKGQSEAIDQIINQLSLIENGLYELSKPKLVSLFVGPSGVGKTEIGKLIAKYYYDDVKNFLKLDMSEYKDSSSVSKILGASPGYIGYDEQPILIKHIVSHPRSVILLDEIEKAHPDVLNLFLQVFDEGVLKDQRGSCIDFKECLIIMTSNVGYQFNKESIGFKKETKENKALEKVFSNEWLNRIDQVIYFKPIEKEAAKQIIQMQLDKFNAQLNTYITCSEEQVEEMLKQIELSKYGARAILRVVKQFMFRNIAQKI